MQKKIKDFMSQLSAFQSTTNVFNPWCDYHPELDISPEAPKIRAAQMERFLSSRLPGAEYLLVAEAVGYQGGRFTGIAMTSERIILGHHQTVRPGDIIQDFQGQRTSNPKFKELKNTQKSLGFTEPTATIVWGEILKNQISPYQVITWNIFPFHPFHQDQGVLSNRTPTMAELEIGMSYMQALLDICGSMKIVAIGNHAAKTLVQLGVENIHVPHPAHGGANKFRAAIREILVAG